MKKIRRLIYSFFVPHEGNNFRAKSLHHNFLAFYLLIGIFFVLVSRMTPSQGQVLGFATDVTVEKLLELTNDERQENNLPALTLNTTLSEAAKLKGQDMLEEDYWAHYSPSGAAPWDFFRDAGYQYEYAGENLAKNFLFSQNVVDAWMDSPGHRENILRPEYSEIGFAIINGNLNGEDTTLVVQFFGRPLGAGPVPDVAQTPVESAPAIETNQDPKVLPAVKPKSNFLWSPLGIFTAFIGFLVLVIFLDLYFASRLNVFRFHGKNLAHIIFLGFVMAGVVFFISKGVIL